MSKKQKIEVMRPIKLYYTDQEVTNMGRQMSYAIKEKEDLKDEAKCQADAFKNQIAAKDTSITTLSNAVNLGYQMVQKSCELIKNFERQMREYWFDGKIVEEEPLTSADYQAELDFAEKANREELNRTDELNKITGDGKPEVMDVDYEEPEIVLTPELKEQVKAFVKLGNECYKKKQYSDSLNYYKAAHKINPSDEKISDLVLKTQNWVDRINDISKTDLNNPTKNTNALTDENQIVFNSYMERGNEAFEKKDFALAEECFKGCLDLCPDNELSKSKFDASVIQVDLLIVAGVLPDRNESAADKFEREN